MLIILIITFSKVSTGSLVQTNNACFILIICSVCYFGEQKYSPFVIDELNSFDFSGSLTMIITIFGGIFSSISGSTDVKLAIIIVLLIINISFILSFLKLYIILKLEGLKKLNGLTKKLVELFKKDIGKFRESIAFVQQYLTSKEIRKTRSMRGKSTIVQENNETVKGFVSITQRDTISPISPKAPSKNSKKLNYKRIIKAVKKNKELQIELENLKKTQKTTPFQGDVDLNISMDSQIDSEIIIGKWTFNDSQLEIPLSNLLKLELRENSNENSNNVKQIEMKLFNLSNKTIIIQKFNMWSENLTIDCDSKNMLKEIPCGKSLEIQICAVKSFFTEINPKLKINLNLEYLIIETNDHNEKSCKQKIQLNVDHTCFAKFHNLPSGEKTEKYKSFILKAVLENKEEKLELFIKKFDRNRKVDQKIYNVKVSDFFMGEKLGYLMKIKENKTKKIAVKIFMKEKNMEIFSEEIESIKEYIKFSIIYQL